jgi:hypothetical protein
LKKVVYAAQFLGMFYEMLDHEDDFEPYLNLFLESSNVPSLAWISNIRSARFDKAYENLLLVSDKEKVIEKKKVVF